jgi:hypothetical protein
MTSNEKTIEQPIFTEGEQYKILTFELDSREWLASILFQNNGLIETHTVSASSEGDAHKEAVRWAEENVDNC